MKGFPMPRKENLGASALPFDWNIFCAEDQGEDRQQGWQQADQHHRLKSGFRKIKRVLLDQPDRQHRDENSKHGTGRVHGPVKAKSQATRLLV